MKKYTLCIMIGCVLGITTIGVLKWYLLHNTQEISKILIKSPSTIDLDISKIANYKSWKQVMKKPALIQNPVVTGWVLRIFVRGDKLIEGDHKELAEHKQEHPVYGMAYINSFGEQTLLNDEHPHFPVNSVIVREKLQKENDVLPELLAVMVKREKGFNLAGGDWEFIVYNGSGTKVESRQKAGNCLECHIHQKEYDFIYRDYLLKVNNQKEKKIVTGK